MGPPGQVYATTQPDTPDVSNPPPITVPEGFLWVDTDDSFNWGTALGPPQTIVVPLYPQWIWGDGAGLQNQLVSNDALVTWNVWLKANPGAAVIVNTGGIPSSLCPSDTVPALAVGLSPARPLLRLSIFTDGSVRVMAGSYSSGDEFLINISWVHP
jgi:hypothetical protein